MKGIERQEHTRLNNFFSLVGWSERLNNFDKPVKNICLGRDDICRTPWIPIPNREANNRQRKAFVLNNYLLKLIIIVLEGGVRFDLWDHFNETMTFLFVLYAIKESVLHVSVTDTYV